MFSFKLNNTLRRVEIGAFEKTDNGTEFIIRGLIVSIAPQ